MLTGNTCGSHHWWAFHLHKPFQIHSFTCIKDPSSLPGVLYRGFTLLPGKMRQTFSEPTRATVGFSSWLWLRVYQQFPYTTMEHSTFGDLSFFHKGNTCHYSILQAVKTGDKTLEGLLKRQPADRHERPELLCVTAPEQKIYPLLGLSWAITYLQCN